jgi:hypothetical protein
VKSSPAVRPPYFFVFLFFFTHASVLAKHAPRSSKEIIDSDNKILDLPGLHQAPASVLDPKPIPPIEDLVCFLVGPFAYLCS